MHEAEFNDEMLFEYHLLELYCHLEFYLQLYEVFRMELLRPCFNRLK